MINKYIVETVLNTSNIIDIISDFCTLKKQGNNYLGLCPFHIENTPSFSVNEHKNIFKCFGCGKGGNVVDFIKLYNKCSFNEAIIFLAKKYHISYENENVNHENTNIENLLLINNIVSNYYNNLLFDLYKENKDIFHFLKKRSISLETIKKFNIGYCDNKIYNLISYLLDKGFDKKYILQLNFISKNNKNSIYNTFYNRIIFPIYSVSGNVLGFGGRLIFDNNKAKYINSSESLIFSKKSNLYGIFFTKNHIRFHDNCIIVEGYIDLLSLYQNGIHNVVATLGTALNDIHIKTIKNYTKNITLIYDGDDVGLKAMLNNIDMMLSLNINLYIVILPNKYDPDNYIRKIGKEKFTDFIINNRINFIEFKYKLLLDNNKNDPLKYSKGLKSIFTSISFIDSTVKQMSFIKFASNLLMIDPVLITDEVNLLKIKKQNSNKIIDNYTIDIELSKDDFTYKTSIYENEIFKIILLKGNDILLDNINIRTFVTNNIKNIVFKNENFISLFKELKKKFSDNDMIEISFFTNNTNQYVKNTSMSILSDKYSISNTIYDKSCLISKDSNIILSYINQIIYRLQLCNIISLIQNKYYQLLNCSNENEILKLQKDYLKLSNLKNQLASKLGIIFTKTI